MPLTWLQTTRTLGMFSAISVLRSVSKCGFSFSYAAAFLCLMGLVPSAPVFIAWGTDNAAPDTVRATTTAIIPGMWNFASPRVTR